MTDTEARTSNALVPYLAVDGAAAALDWYRDVFGAIETMRFVGDDGRVGHAEIVVGGARLMLADEYPEIDVRGPQSLGGTPVIAAPRGRRRRRHPRRAVAAGRRVGAAAGRSGPRQPQRHDLRPVGPPLDAVPAHRRDPRRGRRDGQRGGGEPGPSPAAHPSSSATSRFTCRPRPSSRLLPGAVRLGDRAGDEGGGHIANTRFPMGMAGPPDDGRRDHCLLPGRRHRALRREGDRLGRTGPGPRRVSVGGQRRVRRRPGLPLRPLPARAGLLTQLCRRLPRLPVGGGQQAREPRGHDGGDDRSRGRRGTPGVSARARRRWAGCGSGLGFEALGARTAGAAPGHDDWRRRGRCAGDYGPLYKTKDRTTGEYLLKLPRGFEYLTYGRFGDVMSDGIATPPLHDGMAAFADGPQGRGWSATTRCRRAVRLSPQA